MSLLLVVVNDDAAAAAAHAPAAAATAAAAAAAAAVDAAAAPAVPVPRSYCSPSVCSSLTEASACPPSSIFVTKQVRHLGATLDCVYWDIVCS